MSVKMGPAEGSEQVTVQKVRRRLLNKNVARESDAEAHDEALHSDGKVVPERAIGVALGSSLRRVGGSRAGRRLGRGVGRGGGWIAVDNGGVVRERGVSVSVIKDN